jgi:hypothetical protein
MAWIWSYEDEGLTHFSNTITLTYTVTQPTGNLAIAFEESQPLLLPGYQASTVAVPLTITTAGFNGTGPLELHYSLASPPVWIPYLGAVAIGTATYRFPRNESSAQGGALNLRINRE